jgi:uncharacterized protein (TIGR02117 family)
MKALLRWTLAIVLVAAAAVAAGMLLPRPLFGTAQGSDARAGRILVLSSPIHTDIAVPVAEVRGADFAFLSDARLPLDNPDARWVLFGWGGKAFYVATPEMTDIRIGPLLRSFTLDSSVMHVEVIGAINEQLHNIAAFSVSEDGLQHLLAFARSSFAERDGAPIRIDGTGYGANDTFFEAVGSFNALIGCNTWTAAALRQAGLRSGWWNPLPQTLMVSLAIYN